MVAMNRAQRRAQARAEGRSTRSRRIAALGSGAVLAVSAGGTVLTLAASPAHATVNDTVTTLADSGTGSLRAAIDDANSNGGGTISFGAGLSGTITLASDLPALTQSVTIAGPGASAVTVDGNGHREFYLDTATTLTISGLTLTGGSYAPLQTFGGGTITADQMVIENNSPTNNRGGGLNCDSSTLTLSNSIVSGNVADGGGGGMDLYGCSATIVSTTIADNRAPGRDGGGLYVNGGTTSIENSTISGNYAEDNSGAVYIANSDSGSAAVTISNSTIANNTTANSSDPATGISVSGGSTLDLIQSTVTGNHHVGSSVSLYGALYLQGGSGAASAGAKQQPPHVQSTHAHPQATGGVHSAAAGAVNIVGTIITGNGDTTKTNNFDIFSGESTATVTSDHSLIGTTESSVTVDDVGGTLRNVDPMLGPLADNGGPTQTMALLAGSPAIDAGPVPVPTFPLNDNDQRGAGFPRVIGPAVDIGAFEVQPPPAPPAPPPAVIIAPKFTG
jgi:hypothetical protein